MQPEVLQNRSRLRAIKGGGIVFVIVWPDPRADNPDLSFHRKVRAGCCYDDITERERERCVVLCLHNTCI